MCKSKFTKEQLLFQKQFPHLFLICDYEFPNVTRLHIKKMYNHIIKHEGYIMSKITFEVQLKVMLYHIINKTDICIFSPKSIFEYYYNIFSRRGIINKNNDGTISLKS